MNFDHTNYIPCLRWKQGEYQAVCRLSPATRHKFTPLIEIPGIGYDFEEGKKSKTLDEHLAPVAKRVHEKWGRRPCFVDFHLIKPDEQMAIGIHPVSFVFDELRKRQCLAIPVTGIDRETAYHQKIRDIAGKNKSGACLRLRIEQAAKGSLKNDLDSALSRLKIRPKSCDIIIDLGAPESFLPLKGFSIAIQQIVGRIPYLDDWRTLTILGTSFPKTMGGIKKGGEIVPRYEWELYKILVTGFRKTGLRLPAFGDYAISHPEIPELDWRVVKPYATIRYTIDDGWYIVRGDNVRDEKYGKYKQYHKLSKQLLDSRYYYDSTFSYGDGYIQQCANDGKTGNLMMWRQVGTNHHIEKVTRDIASFYAS